MSVLFNSPLTSANTNAAFVDKNTATTFTVAIFSLENAQPESGSNIVNAQREINLSKPTVAASQTLNLGDQIALPSVTGNYIAIVSGNASPVTLNNIPFSGTFEDGQRITLIGNDNTNIVVLLFNDSQNGCLLNGNAILGQSQTLTLLYSEELERWLEISRSN